ncbi:PREDICTED: putative peptidyl-tRNA hydrolase PTRHD1 [Ipomoea nil]|uniref:putative peptidyl-tRNA hydrolase PTRHD1 n=1 Tax=Ipomoea nil TaxID=35883 RepID=UPI000900967C|nr:PREDICTED: putative peptidyl-tRNA hydrolase PTRHD1 [Ipomoea nil]
MSRALVHSSLHYPRQLLLFSRSIPSSRTSLFTGEAIGQSPATGCGQQSLTTINCFQSRGVKNSNSEVWKGFKRTGINLQKDSITAQMEMEPSKAAAEDLTSTASATNSNATGSSVEEVVVQYLVLRRDLIDTWPLGSIVTQGCHAAVAAIWSNKEDPVTLQYCAPANLDSMHKVTLEVKGEAQILNLSGKLKEGGIAHKLWIEQPENIPTCLAIKPYPKSLVSSFFKRLKLCK